MTLAHDSHTLVTFSLEVGREAAGAASRLHATLHATQPCGYRQRARAIAIRACGTALRATFRYPMVDDGRYDPPVGVARPKLWIIAALSGGDVDGGRSDLASSVRDRT